MYQKEETQFGEFNKIKIFNAATGNGFSVVPEMGGTILEVWLNHQQIIDGCQAPFELQDNAWYKSSILFPFPNRLKDGHYSFNGITYKFPINDTGTNNALHGLSRDVPMDVLSNEVLESKASITLTYFDDGMNKAYPFAFLFDIIYSISDDGGFKINMKFTNEANQQIPVGLGWHPYFKVSDSVNEVFLKVPESKMIEIDDRMLPTGQLLDYAYFEKERLIGKAVLDNGFKLLNTEQQAEVHFGTKDRRFCYWQETGKNKFNFLQLFTPPSRSSIAIEPMTCNIDAFNNGDGLIFLAPEESLEVDCGVRLEKEV